MDIINIENRYFFFDVKPVDREQDNEDDPWWNVHVIYKTKCVDFEDLGEAMTQNELLYTSDCIDRYLRNAEMEKIEYMEPDYDIDLKEFFGYFIINMGYGDTINILLRKENLIKIKEVIDKSVKE